MANKEAVFTVKVNTGNSVQDLQDTDKAVNQLGQDLQKTQTTAKDTSGMDAYAQKLAELDARLDAGGLSMREMTQLMKEYQTVAVQAGTETPIGAQAIQSAGALKDEIGDIKAQTTALSSDFVGLDTAMAGISTGTAVFQGMQSAMALAGGENEELVQTMVKLQAVQGVVNAVSTVANNLNKEAILGIQIRNNLTKIQNWLMTGSASATALTATASGGLATAQGAVAVSTGVASGAMKAFRGALLATGIGAVIVLVGALVVAFEQMGAEAEKQSAKLKALEDSIENLGGIQQFEADLLTTLNERAILEAKLRGASDKELLKLEKENTKARIKQRYEHLNEVIKTNSKIVNNENSTSEQLKKAQDNISAAQTEQKNLTYSIQNEKLKFQLQDQEIAKKQAEEAEKNREKAKQNAEKRKQEQLKIREELLRALQESMNREMEIRESLEDIKIKFIKDETEQAIESVKEQYGDWREQFIKQSAKKEIDALDEKFKTGKMSEQQYRTELETIMTGAVDKMTTSEKELMTAKQLEMQADIQKITEEATTRELEKQAEKEKKKLELLDNYKRSVNDVYQNELLDFENAQKEQIKALNEAHEQKLITDEEYMKAQEALEKQYDDKIVELNKKKNDAIEQANKKKNEEALKDIEAVLDTAGKYFDEIKKVNELLNQLDQVRLDKITKNREDDLTNLDAKMQAELSAEGLTAEQKKQIEEKFAQQKYQVQLQAYNEEEKIKKAQFNRDKAIRIGQIAMDTAGAIVKAVSASPTTFGLPWSAFAGALGIAQAGIVASQQYKSGKPPTMPSLSGGGGGGSATGASASSFTSSNNGTFTAGLTGGQQGETTTTTPATQVYVLESDISSTQNKVKLQESKTSF
jgi:hypothetical protein